MGTIDIWRRNIHHEKFWEKTCLVLPHGNADVERLFSMDSDILTKTFAKTFLLQNKDIEPVWSKRPKEKKRGIKKPCENNVRFNCKMREKKAASWKGSTSPWKRSKIKRKKRRKRKDMLWELERQVRILRVLVSNEGETYLHKQHDFLEKKARVEKRVANKVVSSMKPVAHLHESVFHVLFDLKDIIMMLIITLIYFTYSS